ncbi:hypothetical protein EW146_g7503 [Bondarzewia mesenterica]|uniref:Ketopantoate reductase N-terminal domain-containing protein n=1 Tax=Bondarzewia mesenterica TaxID=1095465 RepID=A0A4S4LKK9_9AGAM|nr:hypothetical protein EW146_g7503 [Bondarzewia mesenterica]
MTPSFPFELETSTESVMSPPLKDVLLVGYGAVGAIYSLILKRSGRARVTTIARSNYEAVTTQGMTFHSEKYGHIEGWKPDRVFSSVAEACDRPYAYVLLTTKAIPEVIRTATLLSPLLSPSYVKAYPQPTYVLMQNGLNVEKDLYKAIESLGQVPKIISTAHPPIFIERIAEVKVTVKDRVSMGTYRFNDFTTTTNTESEQALLSDFADVLSTGGSTVSVVPEIQRVKYAKNMWNAVFASVASLTRHPLTAVFRLPTTSQPSDVPKSVSQAPLITQNTVPVIRAAMQELLKVGHALGFPDDQSGLPSKKGPQNFPRGKFSPGKFWV